MPRLSNVVGPGMDAASGNLVADLLHQAQQGHIVLRSDPQSAKDYLHVDDLLDWLPRIALEGRAAAYNVASGEQTTHREWLDWLASTHAATVVVAERAPWQSFAPIDVTRLRNEFGWKPRRILVDGEAW